MVTFEESFFLEIILLGTCYFLTKEREQKMPINIMGLYLKNCTQNEIHHFFRGAYNRTYSLAMPVQS